ncbi:FKBP-type peptidyl-prolyl cis-trans isomerase [Pseudobacteriovorax antillogorgiicola]|uniref:Peptidyl-prolyl cis-trans isomerase n=2 Tax=Pseudobacteriovorax antillogorgiicola TaxID=1513793 RepID=A0A1Y6BBU1_9BACT|nr:FKBP-type peptidyl-prolyl cis-trans isomerase [Pseudobacteriovorax antillogorgiicola]TCS58776.1 FKBP-type peptidyl-prolyl isomerase-like protein [Pseudobacteriovorax antillogorgiicola]SME94875.1 FKBP-type peptidyl-prolyl cis-trans isomerase [Pseudobacteriovorax antillogorgiicola]
MLLSQPIKVMWLQTISSIVLLLYLPSCTDPEIHPGFKIQEIEVGQGKDEVGKFDSVVLRYTGKFQDGTVFDSSGNESRKYSMRSATLIDGWKVGLLGMRVGGKRRLVIPPEMAFGKKGKARRIPPDATLIFDIELLEIR